MRPAIRYARVGEAHVAFQVVGDGPLDLVVVPEWASHLDVQWDEPRHARFLRRLSSFSRVLLFDKRGVGLSDPVALDGLPTLEEWVDDVRAVLDAAGAQDAAVLGIGAGGPMAMLFAAMYPDRVRALALFNSYARIVATDDYPYGLPAAIAASAPELSERMWGTGAGFDAIAPSLAAEAGAREAHARAQRMAVSPGAIRKMQELLVALDVRGVLPSIHVPTLVLHRRENTLMEVGHARYLASCIPDARLRELPGRDQLLHAGDVDVLADEIEEFLVGTRSHGAVDRMLTTLLFTDIVDSTRRAATLGDARWRDLLDQHDDVLERQIARFGGRRVKSTGDGVLAVFDGPARAVRCAAAARDALRAFDVPIRAGVHTGEVEVRGDDIGGIAVHTGARIAALGGAGDVVVSRTVVDLVAGSGIEFRPFATRELKGVPGTWETYCVAGG